MTFTVVVPAFNEKNGIEAVVSEARLYTDSLLVVDDGSTDGTAEIAARAGATVLRHDVNKGKGAALHTGFEYALRRPGDGVLTLDADGQHKAAEIPRFVEAVQASPRIAVFVGNRMTSRAGMPLVRWWTNRFMSSLLSRMMGQRVCDTQNGYRFYRHAVLPYIPTGYDGFASESKILLSLSDLGFRIGSVPVSTVYGAEASKIRACRDTVRFFRMLLAHTVERGR